MKLEYETTMEDVNAWLQYSVTLPESVRAFRRGGLITATFAAGTIFAFIYVAGKDVPIALMVAVVMFLVVWAMIGSALRHEGIKRVRKAIAKDPMGSALGQRTLEISPECVTIVCSNCTVSYRWVTVRSIIETKDHLFLLLKNLTALIVPRRAFSSDAGCDEFVQEVRRLIPAEGGK